MNEGLNSDGQPINLALGWARLRESRFDELIGLCRGILADGAIVYEEAQFLKTWLERNQPVQKTGVGMKLYAILEEVASDQKLNPDTESELVDFILKIIGGMPAIGKDASYSTKLPLDDPAPEVLIAGRHFCMTGKFLFGTRQQCWEAVTTRGGFVHENPRRDTSFLVIGEIGSRDWLHSTCGLKIEHAIGLRESGLPIAIISEETWCRAVKGCAPICDPIKIAASNTSGAKHEDELETGKHAALILPAAVIQRQPLAGKTIVVTGTLQKFGRTEIEELITKLGGKASGSVSKKTSFVVAGENAGSKLEKAKDLGVEVKTEAEFAALLDGHI